MLGLVGLLPKLSTAQFAPGGASTSAAFVTSATSCHTQSNLAGEIRAKLGNGEMGNWRMETWKCGKIGARPRPKVRVA